MKKPPRQQIRFTICRTCGSEIHLADKAEPEDDVARVHQHVCVQRKTLTLVPDPPERTPTRPA